MDVKAKFHFVSEALDSKTTVVKVKTIQLHGQTEVFQFPAARQTMEHHTKLFEHPVTKRVVNSLKTRNKYRNVNITLAENDLLEIYLDDEGNVIFNEIYLEEVQACISPSPTSPEIPIQTKTIHSISKNFVLEKFDGKNFNAQTWLNLFSAECQRLDVKEDKFAEVLRLFLEGTASQWHSIFLKTNSLAHPWEFWNNSFIDTFNQKSWSEIAYAYNYKYLNGSYLDFALKKRSLLLDVDPELTIKSQINLIGITLPRYVSQRLEKKNVTKIDDLMSLLRQFEPIEKASIVNTNSKHGDGRSAVSTNKLEPRQNVNKQCPFCESIGFPNRFHSEEVCRTKKAQKNKFKNEEIKVANNLQIQNAIALSDEGKNE